jgi:hypothetical protein
MKKSLFYGILIIAFTALIFLSGCVSIPGLTSDPDSENETVNVSEMYNLSIFYPVINGQEKVTESGSYYAVSDSPDVQVVRWIENQKEIRILKETGLLVLTDAEIKDVYFIPSENQTPTKEEIESLINNPKVVDLNYTIKNSNKISQIILEENFTGLLAYTFVPSSDSKSIIVNDNVKAVRIILPPGMTTGNPLIGTTKPKPDLIEAGENGEQILKWKAPIGNVSVKYYSEKAPFYMMIAAAALLGAIVCVYLWYRYQIKRLQKITKYIDPDEKAGFGKRKQI